MGAELRDAGDGVAAIQPWFGLASIGATEEASHPIFVLALAYRSMELKLEYQPLIDSFEELGEGDRSCVVTVLNSEGGQQLTTPHSKHDRFYQRLERFGWARRVILDEDRSAVPVVGWELTEEGRGRLRGVLAVGAVAACTQKHQARFGRHLSVMALKFALLYTAVHVAGMATVYALARAGFGLSSVSEILSIALLIGACYVALYGALSPWRDDGNGIVGQLGVIESFGAQRWLVCGVLAPLLLAIHFGMEQAILLFDPVQAARLAGTSLLRACVRTAFVCFVCWGVLPPILETKKARCFPG